MAETDSDTSSNSSKESRKGKTDSDSEFEMQGQALPVAPFNIDEVDTTAVPLNSQEYLQQVIAERAKLPRIVTATVPKLEPSCRKANLCIFPVEEVVESPHKPSEEWQTTQIANFSDLRYKIECNRESWKGTYFANLPVTNNVWFKFIFEENSSNEDTHLAQQPYLDIVLQMSRGTMENVIKYIIEWISEDKVSVYSAGMWLFAFLACIEVPICIKLMNKLRSFVLLCRTRRKNIDLNVASNKPELVALNLFICLIGKYFGQRDLAD